MAPRVTVLPLDGLLLASLRVTVIVEVVELFATTDTGAATTVELAAEATVPGVSVIVAEVGDAA